MALFKRLFGSVLTLLSLSFFALSASTTGALAQADIALSTFRDSVDSVAGQTEYSYFLRVLNYGDQPAQKARLSLPLPKTLQFISVSPAKQCVFDKAKRRVACDFGVLQSGEEAAKLITMVVKSIDRKAKSTIVSATVSTSSLEEIKTNNQQSETTSFAGEPAKGVDLGITSFEEVVSRSDDKIRSFEIWVANFGDRKISDARLVVSLPDLLGFQSVTAGQNCSFDSIKGQLSCPLPDLDVSRKGGEGRFIRLNLYDRSGQAGAVKLQARIETSAQDIVVGNDLQDLVVTLGARTPKALLLAQNEQKEGEDAPETTAAIEAQTSVVDPAVSTSVDASVAPAGDTSSSTDSSSGLLSTLGGLFNVLNVVPSGGDVDFQIQSFETSPIEVPAGSQFTLNTALINNGPGAANNATLNITVPEGVSFVSGPAACSHDGNPPTGGRTVICSF
ncbi:MAG: hypothetical protein L3J67_10010, partial [Hyphomicrobiaceae bacterium]|nr:hypothetical protein [Hyphomicrobiaceae bacterium]